MCTKFMINLYMKQKEIKHRKDTRTKNDTKCNKYTPCMSHRAAQSMKFMHMDHWVKHPPEKLTETCNGCQITQQI